MSENVAQTVQKVIQNLVAPDLRELKAVVASNQKQTDLRFDIQDEKLTGLQKQTDVRFDIQDEKLTGLQKQIDQRFKNQGHLGEAQFRTIMSAITEVKAQNNLSTLQAISALSGRVAILEARHQ